MRNPHKKVLRGDHMVIEFKGKPMTLDEIVDQLNALHEIGDIADNAQELNMSNYSEDEVSTLNQALVDIHRLAFPAAGKE